MACLKCTDGLVNSYTETVVEPQKHCFKIHDYFIEHFDCQDCDHYWTEILAASICNCGWKAPGINTDTKVLNTENGAHKPD